MDRRHPFHRHGADPVGRGQPGPEGHPLRNSAGGEAAVSLVRLLYNVQLLRYVGETELSFMAFWCTSA